VSKFTARRPRKEFDPTPHRRELVAIIDEIVAESDLDTETLDRILKKYPRGGTGLFSRSEIIAGFRRFGSTHKRGFDEETFVEQLRLRPIRTLSGVTPVTVLTKPYPCPGKCIFCPNDVRMPKSYLSDEPGAQRAEDNRFDPYLQTWNRLRAYQNMGHPVAKVELIVLGGTWSFHPEAYQIWFVKRCFDALNDFGKGVDRRAEAGAVPVRFRELPSRLDGRKPRARVRNGPNSKRRISSMRPLPVAASASSSRRGRITFLPKKFGGSGGSAGPRSRSGFRASRIGCWKRTTAVVMSRRPGARCSSFAAPASSCTSIGCRTCSVRRPRRMPTILLASSRILTFDPTNSSSIPAV